MGDPWQLLDRAMNIESLIDAFFEWGVAAYVIYRNRDRFKQIATKTAVKLKAMNPRRTWWCR